MEGAPRGPVSFARDSDPWLPECPFVSESGVHGIDQRAGGGYIATSRDEINLGEIRATTSEAHYYQASGQNPYGLLNTDGSINFSEVGRAADRSTNSVCSRPDACD